MRTALPVGPEVEGGTEQELVVAAEAGGSWGCWRLPRGSWGLTAVLAHPPQRSSRPPQWSSGLRSGPPLLRRVPAEGVCLPVSQPEGGFLLRRPQAAARGVDSLAVPMDPDPEEEGGALAIPPLRPGEKFHVFVSYSSRDAAWTHALIGRLEADLPGLRVCLHERDFVPGRNILENMAECIQQSQKVLLLLSQDFVQSRWCLLEADLSLFGYCLERKAVIPVLLKPCRVPLHLSHLTYLEATDSRFYPKVLRLLCQATLCGARSVPALRPAASLYSGKALLTLNCINKDSLSSWQVGTFSTLSVPDPLKEVLEEPEVYRRALGVLNGAQSPRSCLRYLGCRVPLGIFLILISLALLSFTLVLGFQRNPPAQRFLLLSCGVFFCPLALVLAVNTLCWFQRFSRRKMRELALRAGEANLLLAPHSVLVGCDTMNKLHFVYVLLEECRQVFLECAEGEALFREAMLRFSSSYACCVAHAYFPASEDVQGAQGHLQLGMCFCQFVSLQLKRHQGLGVYPV